MTCKNLLFGALTLSAASHAQASFFLPGTYEALGGNAAQDDLSDATVVLSDLVDWSQTGAYAAVVRNGGGSATWIGNSDTKSYFMTAAHVVNSASTNTLTTYGGTAIGPVAGSVLYTQPGDFALLEYNAVLDPALFGGEPLTLMDYHLADNYAGYETALVGYGNLTVGERTLGRTRMLSFANLTRLDGQYRTQSTISTTYDPAKPYAGVGTQGDSGGGVFMNLDGVDILIGANSAGNLSSGMVYTSIYQNKAFIDSIVPEGVFTWYSDTQIPQEFELGATAFVDFSDASTASPTGTETYNTVGTGFSNGNSSPLSTGGGLAGFSQSNLDNAAGTITDVDVSLTAYNSGSGQLRSNDASDGSLNHDPVAGIEAFASNDGLWLNNHASGEAGDEFGFVLTFSDLIGSAYDITLLVGSSNTSGQWALTTGTGDASPQLFNNDQDNVLTFLNIKPVDGQIVLTSAVTAVSANYENQFISAATLTHVLAQYAPGDFNGDALVNQHDLDLVLAGFGSSVLPDAWLAASQLQGGVIDIDELNAVLRNWTSEVDPTFTVPEPGTGAVLGLLAVLGRSRRRR